MAATSDCASSLILFDTPGLMARMTNSAGKSSHGKIGIDESVKR